MWWDAALYEGRHGFVSAYGESLLTWVPEYPQGAILDLGCGTGVLTAALARKAGSVLGIDSSVQMIEKARTDHPALRFAVMDALTLPWENVFDVVFSNAVFHWISQQERLLGGVCRALRPGGRLVCEFGARGNITQIEQAYACAVRRHGVNYESPFFFPEPEVYREMLWQAGFHVTELEVFNRPTPLRGGEEGLRVWLRQFLSADLARFPELMRRTLLSETEQALRSLQWDGTKWVADYRRLRIQAVKA